MQTCILSSAVRRRSYDCTLLMNASLAVSISTTCAVSLSPSSSSAAPWPARKKIMLVPLPRCRPRCA